MSKKGKQVSIFDIQVDNRYVMDEIELMKYLRNSIFYYMFRKIISELRSKEAREKLHWYLDEWVGKDSDKFEKSYSNVGGK